MPVLIAHDPLLRRHSRTGSFRRVVMIFLASLLLGWGFSLTEPVAAIAGSLGEFSEVSRFSGRASRVGADGAKASLKITADFAVPDSIPIDLSQGAEVFLEPLFEPESEGMEGAAGIIHSEEFLDFVDGIPLVVAGRAGVDRAKFNSSGRNPSMMVVSLIRRRGILRTSLEVLRDATVRGLDFDIFGGNGG